MKVEVKINDKVTVHAESDSVHDIFKQLATAQITFDDTKCGLCQSEDLQFCFKEEEGNEFYDLRCKKCNARLRFGTSKADKKLYPKRYQVDAKGKGLRDENGKIKMLGKNKNGWIKFNPVTKQEE